MSGPQFVHLQTFSRKANLAGQCVDQIFGELIRSPEYAHHVTNPSRPEIVDGPTPEDLIARHAAMIETATVTVKVKGKVRSRAVRKDRHSLMTAVTSYPLTWDEILGDPDAERALRDWEARNVAFFKRLFGEHYQATYRHVDEPHPHLHVFALPELIPGIDATRLHPGKRAKATAMEKAKNEGAPPKAALTAGNRALKASMRQFQDVYYRHVGEPCGLLRLGPRRQRLSRKDYLAQKAAAKLRSVSALEARSEALKEREGKALAREAVLRHLDQDLKKGLREVEGQQDRLRERESQLNDVDIRISKSAALLRSIVDTLGSAVGLSKFASVTEGLGRLMQYAEEVRSGLASPDEPEEDQDPSPS
jgi:hypothetical protein